MYKAFFKFNRVKSTTVWAWLMHKESCPFCRKGIKGPIQLNTSNNSDTDARTLGVMAKINKPKASGSLRSL